MHITKTLNYQKILSEIAQERGLTELAEHIAKFSFETPKSKVGEQKFNITVLPEATCDGCA